MILLDTHILLWWLHAPDRLSEQVQSEIAIVDSKILSYTHVKTLS